MNFSTKTIGGDVEILASKDYQAIPIKVAAPGAGTVVKAGTPLTAAGASTTGENAVGILLYDVDTALNPNGAAVVIGIINAIVAQEHSGVSYNASNLKAALPGVVLRDNIKAFAADAKLKSLTIGALALVPTFDKNTYAYETSTANTSDTVTVETDDAHATAVIKVGSATVESGSAAAWTASTTNTLTITVTAENGETAQVYTVAVDA